MATSSGLQSVGRPGYGRVETSADRKRPLLMAHMPSESDEVRTPISPSLRHGIAMWSGWAPRRMISPPATPSAARNVAASIRSLIAVCSAGWSSSTPSTMMVDVPAPVTWPPMRFRSPARSAISGSRAALSITVVPLARTAAIITFSVAPTLGNSKRTGLPTRLSAVACTSPPEISNRQPIASSAAMCMSMGRGPKLSPPGRATRAWPALASSGPSTAVEARNCSVSA